ncbi:MAG: hypothetical protein ACLTMH_09705 [Faecalimonas umbilicata]
MLESLEQAFLRTAVYIGRFPELRTPVSVIRTVRGISESHRFSVKRGKKFF